MKCHHYTSIEATVVDDPKADGVKKRLVIGPEDGTPNFAMRIFYRGTRRTYALA